MPGPVTSGDVRAWLGLGPAEDAATLDPAVAAVNSAVTAGKGDPATWADHIKHGAMMLAARVYRRRNSVAGVESFGEVTAYVMRNDPEVAQLLEIGQFERPKVG